MRTLYLSDLDGTLLNSRTELSRYTRETVNGLVRKGLLFSYATARSLSTAKRVVGELADLPVIVYNGAFIMDPATGRILYSNGFTEQESRYVKEVLTGLRIFPLVYSFVDGKECVSWIYGEENEGIRYYLSNREGDDRLRPVRTADELYRGDIFYFTCIGEREELKPLAEAMQGKTAYRCTFQQELYRPEYWCELMPAAVSKAGAAVKLKELLSCDRIVSFGDALNDLPMFEISDECYAVVNAAEELKSRATGIIRSNDEDGVAVYLREKIV